MKISSATGRRPAARPKGPAKVIAIPTSQVVRRRRRAFIVGIGITTAALLAAVALRVYLVHWLAPSLEEVAALSEPESKLLKLVNAERVRRGMQLLRLSSRLTVAARGHSFDMAIRHYLSRRSPEGGTPAERVRGVGIDAKGVDESVYADNGDPAEMVDRALKQWLANPEYRAALLAPGSEKTGIGMVRSAGGYTYLTQDFVH